MVQSGLPYSSKEKNKMVLVERQMHQFQENSYLMFHGIVFLLCPHVFAPQRAANSHPKRQR